MPDQPLDLHPIESRAAEATEGSWHNDPEYGPNFIVSEINGYQYGIGDLAFGEGEQADADREFVLNARQDVLLLVDEVHRLRAELGKYVGHEPTIAEEMAYVQAENERLRTELAQARKQATAETRAHGQTIDERDRALDIADKLAAVIAPEHVIGEHTGMNDPWQNALDHAAEKTYVAPGCACQTAVHPGHYPSRTAPAVSGA